MDLLRLEQQRQALEGNLQQLRQSLKYWQTFEAEYEGLKEEIDADSVGVRTESGLTNLAITYDGELVNEKVIRELTGLDKQSPRSPQQIIRDIERRQEYVQKNIETIQRRFFEAEAKLEELDFAATRDRNTGLPLTEIQEELDDDDNVISSRLTQPENHQANLVESLRKAGLSDDDLRDLSEIKPYQEPLKSAITNALPPVSPGPSSIHKRTRSIDETVNGDGDDHDDGHHERPSIRKKSVSFTADTKTPPEIVRYDSEDGKKSVSFAEKVAVAPAAPPPDSRTVQFSPDVVEIPAHEVEAASPQVKTKDDARSDVQKDLRASFKPGEKVIQLNDDDEVAAEHLVLPEDESEEDAQTRREMLDYHLNEVGHVVAQIDLEEGDAEGFDDYDDEDDDADDDTSSHVTGSTFGGDEDTPYTSGQSDEEEEEDQYGRTKRRVLPDEYRKQMLEMEKRLIGNLGPAPKAEDIEGADAGIDPRDVRRLVIRDKRNSVSSVSSDNSEKKSNSKKRVSFAEDVDVATPGSPPLKAQKRVDGENVAPVTDTVAERSTSTEPAPPEPTKKEKVSRFKKARDITESIENMNIDDGPASELGPPGQILASTLVERQPTATRSTAPSADDPDPIAERRQLAAEYYRRRNDMIKQQGGFRLDPDEEEELGELMEEKDGKLKKVSRFKAARIKSPQ